MVYSEYSMRFYAVVLVYIFPVYRHMGYGKAAVQLLEQKLCAYNPANLFAKRLLKPKIDCVN